MFSSCGGKKENLASLEAIVLEKHVKGGERSYSMIVEIIAPPALKGKRRMYVAMKSSGITSSPSAIFLNNLVGDTIELFDVNVTDVYIED